MKLGDDYTGILMIHTSMGSRRRDTIYILSLYRISFDASTAIVSLNENRRDSTFLTNYLLK